MEKFRKVSQVRCYNIQKTEKYLSILEIGNAFVLYTETSILHILSSISYIETHGFLKYIPNMQIILCAFYIFYLSLVVPPGQYFVYFLGICHCFFSVAHEFRMHQILVVCRNPQQRSPAVDLHHATSMAGGVGRSGEVV